MPGQPRYRCRDVLPDASQLELKPLPECRDDAGESSWGRRDLQEEEVAPSVKVYLS